MVLKLKLLNLKSKLPSARQDAVNGLWLWNRGGRDLPGQPSVKTKISLHFHNSRSCENISDKGAKWNLCYTNRNFLKYFYFEFLPCLHSWDFFATSLIALTWTSSKGHSKSCRSWSSLLNYIYHSIPNFQVLKSTFVKKKKKDCHFNIPKLKNSFFLYGNLSINADSVRAIV